MAREEDVRFGRLALEKGMITLSQMEKVLAELGSQQNPFTLSALLLEKGFITPEQVETLQKLLEEQGKIGDYRLLEKLGEGGMGTVYKALHGPTKEVRALKVLSADLSKDPEYVRRFLREAQASLVLDSPHIVKCYEINQHNQIHYLAMEYVAGECLTDWVEKKGKLSEGEGLLVCQKIAQALSDAREKGIIHRDIKADNIMIGSGGEVKLADFGLVKMVGRTTLTQTGAFLGTPAYISPEQALGNKDIDGRADIYSLGVTLFLTLTGRLPFDNESALVVCHQHITEPLPDPRKFTPELSGPTVQLIQTMTAKKPEERFQTPEELFQAIDALLEGRTPPEKKKPSPSAKLALSRRGARKASPLVSFFPLILMGVVLVGLVVFFSSNSGRYRQEELLKGDIFSAIDGRDFEKALALCKSSSELTIKTSQIEGLKRRLEDFEKALKKKNFAKVLDLFETLKAHSLGENTLEKTSPTLFKELTEGSHKTLVHWSGAWEKEFRQGLPAYFVQALTLASLEDKGLKERVSAMVKNHPPYPSLSFLKTIEKALEMALRSFSQEEETRKIQTLQRTGKGLIKVRQALIEGLNFSEGESLVRNIYPPTAFEPYRPFVESFEARQFRQCWERGKGIFPPDLHKALQEALLNQEGKEVEKLAREFVLAAAGKESSSSLGDLNQAWKEMEKWKTSEFLGEDHREKLESLKKSLQILNGLWSRIVDKAQKGGVDLTLLSLDDLIGWEGQNPHLVYLFYVKAFLFFERKEEVSSSYRKAFNRFIEGLSQDKRDSLSKEKVLWPFERAARAYGHPSGKTTPVSPEKDPSSPQAGSTEKDGVSLALKKLDNAFRGIEKGLIGLVGQYKKKEEPKKLLKEVKDQVEKLAGALGWLKKQDPDRLGPDLRDRYRDLLARYERMFRSARGLEAFLHLVRAFENSGELFRTPFERLQKWIDRLQRPFDSSLEKEINLLRKLFYGEMKRKAKDFGGAAEELEKILKEFEGEGLITFRRIQGTTRWRIKVYEKLIQFYGKLKKYSLDLHEKKKRYRDEKGLYKKEQQKREVRGKVFKDSMEFIKGYLYGNKECPGLLPLLKDLQKARENALAEVTALMVWRFLFLHWIIQDTRAVYSLEGLIALRKARDVQKAMGHILSYSRNLLDIKDLIQQEKKTGILEKTFLFWEIPLPEGLDEIQRDLWKILTLSRACTAYAKKKFYPFYLAVSQLVMDKGREMGKPEFSHNPLSALLINLGDLDFLAENSLGIKMKSKTYLFSLPLPKSTPYFFVGRGDLQYHFSPVGKERKRIYGPAENGHLPLEQTVPGQYKSLTFQLTLKKGALFKLILTSSRGPRDFGFLKVEKISESQGRLSLEIPSRGKNYNISEPVFFQRDEISLVMEYKDRKIWSVRIEGGTFEKGKKVLEKVEWFSQEGEPFHGIMIFLEDCNFLSLQEEIFFKGRSLEILLDKLAQSPEIK